MNWIQVQWYQDWDHFLRAHAVSSADHLVAVPLCDGGFMWKKDRGPNRPATYWKFDWEGNEQAAEVERVAAMESLLSGGVK